MGTFRILKSGDIVFDIEGQAVVATHRSTQACIVNDDPDKPALIGLDKGTFHGTQILGYYKEAAYSIDGSRLDSGVAIYDSVTDQQLLNYQSIRKVRDGNRGRHSSVHSVLSADNEKLFLSNRDIDKGISVYDSTSLEHLFDIQVVQARWVKIAIGLAMILGSCLIWVFLLRANRKSSAAENSETNPASEVTGDPKKPRRLRVVWALMVIGGLFHICVNVLAMHYIPFSSIFYFDSQYNPNAIYSAIMIVGLLLIGLVVAMFVFVKGVSGSTTRLKTTNGFQFFIDPVNAVLALVCLVLQTRGSKVASPEPVVDSTE